MLSLLLLLAAFPLAENETYNLTLDCAILSTVGAEWLDTAQPARAIALRRRTHWAMQLVRAHAQRKGMDETQAVAFVDQHVQRYRDAHARRTDPVKRASDPADIAALSDEFCRLSREAWARERR